MDKNQDSITDYKAESEQKSKIIEELTAKLSAKNLEEDTEKLMIAIEGNTYPVLISSFIYNGKSYKYEDLVANEKLAQEILELNAGIFGEPKS